MATRRPFDADAHPRGAGGRFLPRSSGSSGGAMPPPEIGTTFASYYVGTNKPYGARIELGFAGVDSLGRRYNQPPNPFLRPAVDTTHEEVLGAMATAAKAKLRQAHK